MGKKQTLLRLSVVISLSVLLLPMSVFAQSSSPNYKVEESFFGTGGELEATSPNYQAKQSAGELGVGATESANYLAQAGFNTTDAPFIELIVTGGSLNLGSLSTGSTATGTATFRVRNYLSGGYNVAAAGPLPTNAGGAQISGLSSPTISTTGTEQFGINLVANTSPATFGADPVQVPDNTFSFGQAASGYNTANQYKYVVGETIAASPKSTGYTNYTVSYIVNIGVLTDAGTYTTDQVFVATAAY